MCRDLNGLSWILEGVDAFEKYHRIFREFRPGFFRMLTVVQADANDRTRLDRREQPFDLDLFRRDAE